MFLISVKYLFIALRNTRKFKSKVNKIINFADFIINGLDLSKHLKIRMHSVQPDNSRKTLLKLLDISLAV